jgi:hypothetical protein
LNDPSALWQNRKLIVNCELISEFAQLKDSIVLSQTDYFHRRNSVIKLEAHFECVFVAGKTGGCNISVYLLCTDNNVIPISLGYGCHFRYEHDKHNALLKYAPHSRSPVKDGAIV